MRDRFPLSPWLAPLRAILEKLDPPKPKAPLPEHRPKATAPELGTGT
jgi:hypothetical protein